MVKNRIQALLARHHVPLPAVSDIFGSWLCLGMFPADRYWKDFCHALGIPELVDDARFNDVRARTKNHRELVAILDDICKQNAPGMAENPQGRR